MAATYYTLTKPGQAEKVIKKNRASSAPSPQSPVKTKPKRSSRVSRRPILRPIITSRYIC